MIYIHDLNPIAFYIGTTPIAWYWLNYLVGYTFVYFFSLYLSHQQVSPLSPNHLPTYTLCCWFAVILGGRLGYVLIYRFSHYAQHPELIYQIWRGGMSFHGALLGAALTCLVVARYQRQSPFLATDLFCLLIPIPIALGRITNFVNAELLGKLTKGHWGVVFAGQDLPRHPSQLYQAGLEGFLLFLLLWSQRHQLKRPGKITGTFLMGYGVLRSISEFYRLPDPQLGYLIGPFTMGHILCSVMIVCGIVILTIVKDRQISDPDRHKLS